MSVAVSRRWYRPTYDEQCVRWLAKTEADRFEFTRTTPALIETVGWPRQDHCIAAQAVRP